MVECNKHDVTANVTRKDAISVTTCSKNGGGVLPLSAAGEGEGVPEAP